MLILLKKYNMMVISFWESVRTNKVIWLKQIEDLDLKHSRISLLLVPLQFRITQQIYFKTSKINPKYNKKTHLLRQVIFYKFIQGKLFEKEVTFQTPRLGSFCQDQPNLDWPKHQSLTVHQPPKVTKVNQHLWWECYINPKRSQK